MAPFPGSTIQCLPQSSNPYINILLFRGFSWGPSLANPAPKSAISAQVICLSLLISWTPKPELATQV